MAVTFGVESRTLYIGLSTDTKPTGADFSAKFYEHDTGITFIWTGSSWVEYLPWYRVEFDPAAPRTY